jgi:glycosyltransferase involved in cell wall biosynthesis
VTGAGAGSVALSVILPAHQEAHALRANLERTCAALGGESVEVVVVDDGSTDGTHAEAVRAAEAGLPVVPVRLDANVGKGAALFRGFAASRGALVAFLDADLEIAPQSVLRLREVLERTGADVVVGTRKGASTGFPLLRRAMSRGFRAAVSFLFGLSVSDTQAGVKLFRREVLERAAPRMSVARFAFDVELLVAATRFGYEIAECPVEVAFHREGGLGRMRTAALLGTLADSVRIYYRASFWSWLNPGAAARLWMLVFVLGVFLFGIGVGKLLTPVVLRGPARDVFRVVALQFLPPLLRDWLVLLGGLAMLAVSAVQLNKILLAAFARRDRAGLAGLLRR